MSNGRQALLGFEYQATVNLDLLLTLLDGSTDDVVIRPEGDDDLVVQGTSSGVQYYQIKKPKESETGERKVESWSLAEVTTKLLGGTIDRIGRKEHRQTWILGDPIDDEVQALLLAGAEAPAKEPTAYFYAVHVLAFGRCGTFSRYEKHPFVGWKPRDCKTISSLLDAFRRYGAERGAPDDLVVEYERIAREINSMLPHVLGRIEVRSCYGSENEVQDRVQRTLQARYQLDWEEIKHTLLPCLRNYIYSISSSNGKTISKVELEYEIRNIWPRMTMVCDPPALEMKTLRRTWLVQEALERAKQGALEITGISGAGKTTIAGEMCEYLKSNEPDTRALYVAVQPNRSFRDVIAGVAFNLRGAGLDGLFPIAVKYTSSNEGALNEIARAIAPAGRDLMVVVDLVGGSCSDEFASELAKFLEKLPRSTFRFVVMGQESSFRNLSSVHREALGLSKPLDIPGFNFEEFLELVKQVREAELPRVELWSIFEMFTAGRQTGMYARLARAVAGCATIEEMRRLAGRKPEEALQEADRGKYNLLAESLKGAANKLLCFMLPFREEEAASLFPWDPVKAVVIELLRYGLLRELSNQRLEFHETVRKGLAGLVPKQIYTQAHETLAEYYRSRGETVTAVYHLEQAGRTDQPTT